MVLDEYEVVRNSFNIKNMFKGEVSEIQYKIKEIV